MANTGFLDVSELSFDGIKSNLKTYLQNQAVFQDYDFEGSNLSALLDILSYNTYYNAYYLNMIGSEMFLDSAQMRSSVISHAKELNYIPKSRTSAKAKVVFTVNTGNDRPSYVIIPAGFIIKTTVDGVNFDFSTSSDLVINSTGTNQYYSDPVYVYEGKLVTEYFNVDGVSRYVISSENVDTNSLQVTVINSSTNPANTVYNQAYNLYGLNGDSPVFFVQGYGDNQYEIVFGDNIFGKGLTNGNIVKVDYRSTNGVLANKASSFSVPKKLLGLYSVSATVTTGGIAIEGSERESIDSVKFNAPRHYTTQDRAVTKDDFINLILENFPQIQTIQVYGGEEANPPQYGSVIISMIPYGPATIVSSEIKSNIINFLKTKTITTKPIIVDPEYLFVEIVTNVFYNPSLTQKSTADLKSLVVAQIANYQTLYLNNFGDDLRKSKIVAAIDSADPSIVSNQTYLRAEYRITPVTGTPQVVSFTFGNPIYRPFLRPYANGEEEAVHSTYFSYVQNNSVLNVTMTDDGMGNLRLYYISTQGIPVIVEPNIGTIDYSTGTLNFTLNAFDYVDSIDILATLNSDDILVTSSKYLLIDYDKLSVTIDVFKQ